MTSEPNILVWQFGRFGAGPRYGLELAHALRTFCGLRTRLLLAEDAEILSDPGCRSQVDLTVRTYANRQEFLVRSLRAQSILRPILGKLAEEPPSIAINVMGAYWDTFLATHLRRLGVPVVSIVHDASPHPGDNYHLAVWLHRRLVKQSVGVITLSDYVAGLLRGQSQLDGRLHWTIPLVCFDYAELGLPAPVAPGYPQRRPFRLLLAGRLKAYKGLDLFLGALEHIDPDTIEVRVVGSHHDSTVDRMLHQAGAVDFCPGWISDRGFIEHVDWADAMMAPHVEASQSAVVPLAFSRRRPVVATPVGGLVEQVRDGVTGMLATETSPRAFADAIRRLIDDPDLFQSCADNALSCASGPWSWREIGRRHADALIEAIAGTPRDDASQQCGSDAEQPTRAAASR